MSWFSKGSLLFVCALISVSAWAQRINFEGARGTAATLQTSVLPATRGPSGVEVTLAVPGLDVDAVADGFDAVRVEGLVPLQNFGSPELVTTGSLIAVPEGYEPSLTVVSQKSQSLEHVRVQPAQRQWRCNGDRLNTFSFNSELYASRALYPATNIRLEEVGRLQGLRLVRLAFYPLQMEMGTNRLRVTTSADVRVTLRQTGERSMPVLLTKSYYQIARHLTANGRALAGTVRAAAGAETMLIVTADELKDSLQPLVDWKTARGLNVEVVTLTQAGGTREAVKTYLQNYYNNHTPKPSYFLFVGNKDSMPAFSQSTSSGDAYSDYTYTLTAGGNVPAVLYGRLLADNISDLQKQMSRWVDYEKSPEKGASWYASGITIASDEGSNPSDKEYAIQIQGLLKRGTYKTVDGFFQGDGAATFANISGALSSGRTWLAYIGHGSGTSWGSTNGTFDNNAVGRLQNGGKLPIIVDVACLNASWVDLPTPFGKAWVTHTNGSQNAGAVAFLGGSVSVSWNPPAVMSVGMATTHFQKPVYTLGGTWMAGQLYLIEKMGTGEDTTDNLRWYNLFGDPSMLIRTNTPLAYEVKSQVTRRTDGVQITVTALDGAGKGVAGLQAAVGRPANPVLAVGKTDAQGSVVLTIPGLG
jgi:hypothetical protein